MLVAVLTSAEFTAAIVRKIMKLYEKEALNINETIYILINKDFCKLVNVEFQITVSDLIILLQKFQTELN